jgi:6-phosphogluconolactonase (cycloisomerase 2 family)
MPGAPGFITGLSFDSATGALTGMRADTVPGPAQSVAITPSAKYLYVPFSSESQTGIAAFAIASSGTLTQISRSPFSPRGFSYATVDGRGKFVYVSGMDRVWAYHIDKHNGKPTLVSGSPFQTGNITGELITAAPH